MAIITFRPITASNWRAAAEMRVSPEQEAFLTENIWSIAEAAYHKDLVPLAIHRGGVMIGFLMYGQSPSAGQWWLLRFMIAPAHQGKGYGAAALQQLLDSLRKEGLNSLQVGYHTENHVAEVLYRKAGFVPAAMAPWGEKTAVYWFIRDEDAASSQN